MINTTMAIAKRSFLLRVQEDPESDKPLRTLAVRGEKIEVTRDEVKRFGKYLDPMDKSFIEKKKKLTRR